jgi:hypothetical protein
MSDVATLAFAIGLFLMFGFAVNHLSEPLSILALAFIVFNGFEWVLCKMADWLGIGCEDYD